MHGVVIKYTKDQRIVAIELLDAGKRTARQPLDLIDLAVIRSSSHAVDSGAEKKKSIILPVTV
jgi:hypothetical protein